VTLDDFNALPEPEAQQRLAECLDVPRWVDAVSEGRPYADLDALHTVARVAADLDDAELEQALARHPRIGERAGSGHDAAHSAREQAGVDPADREVAARIAEGNVAYDEKFERVFLIRASGRTGPQILAELERRLGNDAETERTETVQQLTEIAILRLDQLVGAETGE
jgi:2-oxo-4-hydroxy-4-carboxy-5-ureidoimidazoline decarboxylase